MRRFVRHKLLISRLVQQSGAIAPPGLDTHPCLLGTEGRDSRQSLSKPCPSVVQYEVQMSCDDNVITYE